MAATAYPPPSQPKTSATATNIRIALFSSLWTNQQMGRNIYGAVIAPTNEKRNLFALDSSHNHKSKYVLIMNKSFTK